MVPAGSAQQELDENVAFCMPSKGAANVRIKLWLMDTGCGHDLIGQQEVKHLSNLYHHAEHPQSFHTANGATYSDLVIDMSCKELDKNHRTFEAYLMDGTLPVMSIGLRCEDHGYDFVWLGSRGWPPYFITPTGRIIMMEVIGKIPYIRPGDDEQC